MNISTTNQENVSTDPIGSPNLDANEDEVYIDKPTTLKKILKYDLLACDAKWTLFVAASQSYRYETELFPVPPQFIISDETTSQINMKELLSAINDTPRLHVVLQLLNDDKSAELKPIVIDLLFWVLALMADPYLRPLRVNKLMEYFKKIKITVPEIYKPTHGIEVVNLQNSSSDVAFDTSQNSNVTRFAFYGNQLDVFYSLIQNGFNRFHSGTSLYSNGVLELNSSLKDAITKSPSGAAWGSSSCGSIISCVAICEYVDKPEYVKHKKIADGREENIEIQNLDYVRLRYLLLYGNRTADIEDNEKICNGNWIKRNGKNLSLVLSIAVLITALSATQRVGSIRDICSKHVNKMISFCHKTLKLLFV